MVFNLFYYCSGETYENLRLLIEELRKHPQETEWIEFKVNNSDPDKIGKNLCAISNSATLLKGTPPADRKDDRN